MEVKVQTFRNPFSFFCIPAEEAVANIKHIVPENISCGFLTKKFDLTGIVHGQYVAVLWNDHWARGIITIETQFLIWLVDYGIYLRPNDKTVFVNLPAHDKQYPSKVFEASLHGITPVDKVLTEMCEIKNDVAMTWSNGAIEKSLELIASADKIYLLPVAMLSTKHNDVVIGDMYLLIKGQRVVNLKDALEEWPVFLSKNPEIYIENLSKFYIHRRHHRASLKKPAIAADLPTMSLDITLAEYCAICASAPELVLSECDDSAEEGSTLTYLETSLQELKIFVPTPEEIKRYSSMYVTVSGREHNVLNVLCNKARDLYMCERYADQKYIGRASSRYSNRDDLDDKS